MNKDDYIRIVYKSLKGEATETELKDMEAYRNSNEKNQALFYEIVQSWNLSQVDNQISDSELDSDFKKLNSKIQNTNKLNIRRLWIIRSLAASILLVLAAVVLFQLYLRDTEIAIVATENELHRLPDGSEIFLEIGSEIIYPKKFEGRRNVILKGNALFNVAHDERSKFVVSIDKGEVVVLGTRFYVKQSTETTSIYVKEGLVQFNTSSDSVRLEKDEIGILKEAQLEKLNIPVQNFDFLQIEKFIFRNTALKDILRELHLLFDTDIELQNEALFDCTLTLLINSIELNDILDNIAIQLEMKIEKEGDKIILNEGQCL